VLAVAFGVTGLANMSQKCVPPGVYVEKVSIGGLSYTDVIKKLESELDDEKPASLKIDIGDGNIYEIPFSKIDAGIDGEATVEKVRATVNGIKSIPYVLNAYFGQQKLVIQPAYKLNEGKLRKELIELAEKVNVSPSDAVIKYNNGIIEREAETVGYSLNVANAAEVIQKQLAEDPNQIIRLNRSGNFEFQTVEPDIKLKDFDDIQQVFAEYSTKIMDVELIDSIGYAVEAINGVILPGAAENGGKTEFSFVERLKSENNSFMNNNEGYDQVASTLYAAILSAGIPAGSITRMAHELAVDYIEPGLDAWISGNAGDLRFSNPFDHKIAIFAQIEEDRVIVAIAGNMNDGKGKHEIKTEVTQRFSPQIYYVENESLKKGEKVTINPGKEGIMVNVYVNDVLIGTDKYEAEKKIVQIGPGTDVIDTK